MSNPIDEFNKVKQGGFGQTMGTFAREAGQSLGREGPKALGSAAAGLGVAAGAAAASKIYDALTKRRDFKTMLEHNPHLVEAQMEDPKRFNQLYSTLRTMNPEFARDPMVAGSYMDRLVSTPGGAGIGGIATDLLQARDRMHTPVSDAFHGSMLKGIGASNSGRDTKPFNDKSYNGPR